MAGVATFAGCDIDLASITPYTLDATDGVLVGDTSTGIAVAVGGAARMAFTTQPSATATGGTDFVAQPVVTVQDAGGNTVTTDTSSVTLSLSTPAGAVLGCTSNGPIATVFGVATFAGCDINLASATPYTLRAVNGAQTALTSAPITVSVGTATQIGFVTQPSATAVGGVSFAAQPAVAVQDAGGNTVTGNVSGVTLTITTPAGAVLGCTDNGPLAAVAGVATFAGCDIDKASATPYTLHAAATGLGIATSTGITITVGAPAHLVFSTQPSTIATGGTDFAQQPVVTIQDAANNTVTTDTSGVTLTVTTPTGAALGCTDNGPVRGSRGRRNLPRVVTSTPPASPPTRCTPPTARSTVATSTGVTVATGVPARPRSPRNQHAGDGRRRLRHPARRVRAARRGNTVTTDTSGVTLTITTPAGAALGCTPDNGPLAAVAGVATFAGCDINLASAIPTRCTRSTVRSSPRPSSAIHRQRRPAVDSRSRRSRARPRRVGPTSWPSPSSRFVDAGGNTVTGNTSGVTLTITTPAGAALSCTPDNGPLAAVAGVATFAGCDINLASVTPYTLHAADGALTPATSTGITVSTGSAARLGFTTQPSTTATGGTNFAQQPAVSIQDAGGNTVTGNTTAVTLTITTPAGATLGCTPNNGPLAVVAGSQPSRAATSTSRSVTPYTLHAVDGALAAADSTGITVSVGAASQLAFTPQPSTTATGGTNFSRNSPRSPCATAVATPSRPTPAT